MNKDKDKDKDKMTDRVMASSCAGDCLCNRRAIEERDSRSLEGLSCRLFAGGGSGGT